MQGYYSPTFIKAFVSDRLRLHDIRDILAESYGKDEDDRTELRLRDDHRRSRRKVIMDRRWS